MRKNQEKNSPQNANHKETTPRIPTKPHVTPEKHPTKTKRKNPEKEHQRTPGGNQEITRAPTAEENTPPQKQKTGADKEKYADKSIKVKVQRKMKHTCGIEMHAQDGCPGFLTYVPHLPKTKKPEPSERHPRRKRARKAKSEQREEPQPEHRKTIKETKKDKSHSKANPQPKREQAEHQQTEEEKTGTYAKNILGPKSAPCCDENVRPHSLGTGTIFCSPLHLI